MILGFLTILKNCQASSTFEALNSTWLSSCQRHVRPLFEMKWRPRAFGRVSTEDSDILSSCVDLGYTNQFCVPEVTSVFFSSCDSVVVDSLEFNQSNRGSFCV